MLLSVIARPGDAFQAMRHLLEDNHEPRKAQLRHIRRAIAIYRSLLDGGVVEKLDTPDAEGRSIRLTVDLQQDFALNQPLSTFALASFDLLDPESPPTHWTWSPSSSPRWTIPARSSPPSRTRNAAWPWAR